jgi:hypothetical protein
MSKGLWEERMGECGYEAYRNAVLMDGNGTEVNPIAEWVKLPERAKKAWAAAARAIVNKASEGNPRDDRMK